MHIVINVHMFAYHIHRWNHSILNILTFNVKKAFLSMYIRSKSNLHLTKAYTSYYKQNIFKYFTTNTCDTLKISASLESTIAHKKRK